jgi:type IV pilus assembly protein PilC
MGGFKYEISTANGEIRKGTVEANNQEAAISKLKELGGYLISIKEKSSPHIFAFFKPMAFPFKKKVKPRDIVIFNRQLVAMIGAGLPLVNSLNVISAQTENQKLAEAIKKMVAHIQNGSSFSAALSGFPKIFSPLYVSMVSAGEKSGTTEVILKKLATFLEKSEAVRQEIKSATTYPKFLISVAFIGVGFIFAYVLPKFMAMFSELGATLPLPTRLLILLVDFLANNKILVGGVVLGAWAGLIAYGKTAYGKFNYHRFQLKLPIIGNIIKKIVISRTCHTLGILYSSGIPILQALEMVQEVAHNLVIAQILRQARQAVEQGGSLTEALSNSREFPPMVTYMMRTGEESGKMDEMLTKISDFYDQEVETVVKKFSSVLEPILIGVMAIIIGFIAISVFLPMLDMIDAIKLG